MKDEKNNSQKLGDLKNSVKEWWNDQILTPVSTPIAKFLHRYFSAPLMDYASSHTGDNAGEWSLLDCFKPYIRRGLSYRDKDECDGVTQSTYLLPPSLQGDIFTLYGYIKGKPGDYGLVNQAVREKFGNVPVWQTAPDVISRERLVNVGRLKNNYNPHSPGYAELHNAGTYPTEVYIDPVTNTLISKSWDLNNYGKDRKDSKTGGAFSRYSSSGQVLAELLDAIGSPVVVTTGWQPMVNKETSEVYHYGDNSYLPKDIVETLDNYFSSLPMPLHRLEDDSDYNLVYTLPNVTVIPEKKYGNK